jgi:hypothetical protein
MKRETTLNARGSGLREFRTPLAPKGGTAFPANPPRRGVDFNLAPATDTLTRIAISDSYLVAIYYPSVATGFPKAIDRIAVS